MPKDDRLIFLVFTAQQKLRTYLKNAMSEAGVTITPAQSGILFLLKKNDRVCIEVDLDSRIVRGDTPCRWAAKYRSVIGFGRARIVDGETEKKAALEVIMAHYGGGGGEYDEKSLKLTTMIEVVLESVTGKQSLLCSQRRCIPSRIG